MKTHAAVALVALFSFSSCSSAPVVPMPPTVEVAEFNSTLITPDAIEFVARVKIHNQMRGELQLQQVDYAADLHDRRLFDETFAELQPMRSRSTTTVTLPFRVSMQDLGAQIEDVLSEESVRVSLQGLVVPVGFDAIPFAATKVLPLPKPPQVSLAGSRGNPLDGEFTVFLDVDNPNCFAMSFGSVETWLKLNGRKYDLLRTESFSSLPAGGRGRVALTMRTSRAKGIGMIVNVVKNGSTDFAIGGKLSCRTEHGVVLMPVELQSTPAAPGR